MTVDSPARGSDALVLRWPTLDEEAECLRAHHATSPHHPHFLHDYREGMPFAAYLDVLAARARPQPLHAPPHDDGTPVPSTFLLAFVDARIVGRVSIRHALHPVDGDRNGHIGYVVVPAYRQRGHATAMLRQAVGIAHDALDIPRVLVTCDLGNIASIRTIERAGGVFDDIVPATDAGKPKRRYWFVRDA